MIILLIIQLISLFSYNFNLHTLNYVLKIPFINTIIKKHNYIHKNNNSNDLISSEIKMDIEKIINNNKIIEKIYLDSISFFYSIFKNKKTTIEIWIK